MMRNIAVIPARKKTASSSSLLYHEESPRLVLRPTAPPRAFERIQRTTNNKNNTAAVRELSLVGWSYPAVLDKLLPLFTIPPTTRHHQQQDETLLLVALNIVSTELWVSSQFRSPFSLGVDGVTGALLQSPTCQFLETLVISRACNKTEEDWFQFCQSLRSVPHLKRLELCDAANTYTPPPQRRQRQQQQQQEQQQQQHQNNNRHIDLSILFETVGQHLPLLQVFKLHMNMYLPANISLNACFKFVSASYNLQILSLHMIQIYQPQSLCTNDSSARSAAAATTTTHPSLNTDQSFPKDAFRCLHTLHLTMVDFDSQDTWHQVILGPLGIARENSTLRSFSLTSPSMKATQYHALWSQLFLPPRRFPSMETFQICMWRTCQLLSLKTATDNNSTTSSLVEHIQPRLQRAIQPTLSHLFECWRNHPPPRHMKAFVLPYSLGNDDDDDDDDDKNKDWITAKELFNLYQHQPRPFHVHDRASVVRHMNSILHRKDGRTVVSIDYIFHLVSFCAPTLFCHKGEHWIS